MYKGVFCRFGMEYGILAAKDCTEDYQGDQLHNSGIRAFGMEKAKQKAIGKQDRQWDQFHTGRF